MSSAGVSLMVVSRPPGRFLPALSSMVERLCRTLQGSDLGSESEDLSVVRGNILHERASRDVSQEKTHKGFLVQTPPMRQLDCLSEMLHC